MEKKKTATKNKAPFTESQNKRFGKSPAVKNFSRVENSALAFKTIKILALRAGKKAAKQAKNAGVSRTYVRSNNTIVNISSEGKEIIIPPHFKRTTFYIDYKPRTILHVAKR